MLLYIATWCYIALLLATVRHMSDDEVMSEFSFEESNGGYVMNFTCLAKFLIP